MTSRRVSRGQLVALVITGVVLFLLGFLIGYFTIPNGESDNSETRRSIEERRKNEMQKKEEYHSKFYKSLNKTEIGKNLKYVYNRFQTNWDTVLDYKPVCKKLLCIYSLPFPLSEECCVLSRNTLIDLILWQMKHNIEKGARRIEVFPTFGEIRRSVPEVLKLIVCCIVV